MMWYGTVCGALLKCLVVELSAELEPETLTYDAHCVGAVAGN